MMHQMKKQHHAEQKQLEPPSAQSSGKPCVAAKVPNERQTKARRQATGPAEAVHDANEKQLAADAGRNLRGVAPRQVEPGARVYSE